MPRISKAKIDKVLDATAERVKRADKRPKSGTTSDREIDIALSNRPKAERELAKNLPPTGLATKARIDEAVRAVKDELVTADQNHNGLSSAEIENLSRGAQLAFEAAGGRRTNIVDVRAGGTTPVGGAQRLTPERIATITDYTKDVIASNDMMNGEIPTTGQWYKLDVLRGDPAFRGTTNSVHIPIDPLTPGGPLQDPSKVERMWLLAVGRDGISRTATFDVPLVPVAPYNPLGRSGPEAVAELAAPVRDLQAWCESGDNGVNVTTSDLPGVPTFDEALQKLRRHADTPWTWNESNLTAHDEPRDVAVQNFVASVKATLSSQAPESLGATADEMIEAFTTKVTDIFAALEDVHRVTGADLGGDYIIGKTRDGYVGAVVQAYSDG